MAGSADQPPIRPLADRAFARAAGAPLVPGNTVRILNDGVENYGAWLDAIASAQRSIHFETYILHGDEIGRRFAEALAGRARCGVRVRFLCDWFGSLTVGSRPLWTLLETAGVEARSFNPPRFDQPLGWISRDHRKTITIDGRLGFVSGLCLGRAWAGDPARHIEPWRDIGVAITGPAVADLELAFAETWALAGGPIPPSELPDRSAIPTTGTVPVRVVAGTPVAAELYRLDQLIAGGAQRTLWLTDAYFVGTTAYIQALKAAAKDGVDVRLLVPGASDVPFVRSVSRAGYRPLLDSGIRIFEWNGTMLHAKAAVADSRWARVGSTNLNLTSWMGNWELDVAVEDDAFATAMEAIYLHDLSRSTEVLLSAKNRVHMSRPAAPHGAIRQGRGRRAAAGALGVGRTVGAAITNHRELGPAEARVMAGAGATLLAVTAALLIWPRAFTVPASVLLGWVAISLLLGAARLGLR
jgi:cardiolipin synthase A/B